MTKNPSVAFATSGVTLSPTWILILRFIAGSEQYFRIRSSAGKRTGRSAIVMSRGELAFDGGFDSLEDWKPEEWNPTLQYAQSGSRGYNGSVGTVGLLDGSRYSKSPFCMPQEPADGTLPSSVILFTSTELESDFYDHFGAANVKCDFSVDDASHAPHITAAKSEIEQLPATPTGIDAKDGSVWQERFAYCFRPLHHPRPHRSAQITGWTTCPEIVNLEKLNEVAVTFKPPSRPLDSNEDYRGSILKPVDRDILFNRQGSPNHISTLPSAYPCSGRESYKNSPHTPDFDALFPSGPDSIYTAEAGQVQIPCPTLATSDEKVDAKDDDGKELSDNERSLLHRRRRRSTSSYTSEGSPTASGCSQFKKAKLTASIHVPTSP